MINSLWEAVDHFRREHGGNIIGTFAGRAKSYGTPGVICYLIKSGDIYYYVSFRSYWWDGWTHVLKDRSELDSQDLGSSGETVLEDIIYSMNKNIDKKQVYCVILPDGSFNYIKAWDLIIYIENNKTWISHMKSNYEKDEAGYPVRILSKERPFRKVAA